jgi:hypothetical protein
VRIGLARHCLLCAGGPIDGRPRINPLKETFAMRCGWIALAALALASSAAVADEAPTKPPETVTRLAGPGPSPEALRQKRLQWERAQQATAAAHGATASRVGVAAPKFPGLVTMKPLTGAALAEAQARQLQKMSAPASAPAPRLAGAPRPWSPHVDKPSEARTSTPRSIDQLTPEQRAKRAAAPAAASPARRGEP